jgi:hypothetical protein
MGVSLRMNERRLGLGLLALMALGWFLTGFNLTIFVIGSVVWLVVMTLAWLTRYDL